MPRRNTRGSHRRTTRRPEPEQIEDAVNYEAIARRLVRRGPSCGTWQRRSQGTRPHTNPMGD